MSIETLEYDVIGLGFGPANLAIAVTLEEDRRVRENGLRYCFLEKKQAFEWHGGMLLDDSRMQISFLKDLATLRNPSSRYTFVNYLHQKRRLEAFINISTFTPSRLEYNDYLGWAAGHFAEADVLLADLAEIDWQAVAGDGDSAPVKALRTLPLPRLKNLLRWRLRVLGWRSPAATRLDEFAHQLITAAPDRHPSLNLPDGQMRVAGRHLHWFPAA